MLDNWERQHVENLDEVLTLFDHDQPTITGFDSESTGLHIREDKPFLYAFGWLSGDEGRVFSFEPTPVNMAAMFHMANKAKAFIAHNVKFDMHMTANLGYEEAILEMDNFMDSATMVRLSTEAVPARDGGDSLTLKSLAAKYIHPRAADYEASIKHMQKILKQERTKALAAALKQFPLVLHGEQQYTVTGKERSWGIGEVNKFLKDITNELSDLPEDVREVWEMWADEYGELDPTYFDIYKRYPEEMKDYVQFDVILMLEIVRKALPVVNRRKQMVVLERENKAIKPLFRMERVGLPVDQEKLEADRVRVREYIREKRNKLHELAGERITCNQHDRIKDILEYHLGERPASADDAALKRIIKNHDGVVSDFAKSVRKLRTLEKWYSTYILKIQKDSSYDGRFYTQINQSSAVSGRVGSDSQQFPKKALLDDDENILFHPRAVFTAPEGWYWYFLDFSQVELRVQANYTLLMGSPDLNLCRAYMPYKCHKETGEEYDYSNPEKRAEWNQCDWYLNEKPDQKWQPTDIHAATTRNTLRFLGYSEDDDGTFYYTGTSTPTFGEKITAEHFKELRGEYGKRYNFSKNYGIGLEATMENLDVSQTVAEALSRGYTESFPEVLTYQQLVANQHIKNGYVTNLYGRRYYLQSFSASYKLANYLIQGTCADDLKECIIEIDHLLKGKKSLFVMTVHDELGFFIHAEEQELVAQIKKIMEKDRSWSKVPIVSDVEVTTTSWYEKEVA